MPFSGSFVSSFGFGRRSSEYPPNSNFDPYFSFVTLLLHMDGPNGSTNFIDSSQVTKTVNALGGAQISTNDFKFGNSSAYFNNTNAYLTVNPNSAFAFSTINWTVELFCAVNPVEADVIINKATGFGFFPFQIRISGGRFNARGCNSNSVIYNLGATTGPIVTAGSWYHVALTRQNNNIFFYVNGDLVEYSTFSGPLFDPNAAISLAGLSNGQGLTGGYIDEVRITNGISRYPNGTNFVVPSVPFPN